MLSLFCVYLNSSCGVHIKAILLAMVRCVWSTSCCEKALFYQYNSAQVHWCGVIPLITLTNIVSGDPERKHVETPCLRHILMPQQRVLGLVAIFAKQAFFSSPRLSRGVSQTSCLQECQALYSVVRDPPNGRAVQVVAQTSTQVQNIETRLLANASHSRHPAGAPRKTFVKRTLNSRDHRGEEEEWEEAMCIQNVIYVTDNGSQLYLHLVSVTGSALSANITPCKGKLSRVQGAIILRYKMSSRMASFLSEHTMADVKILKPNAYNPPVYDFGENISDHSLLVSRAHKQSPLAKKTALTCETQSPEADLRERKFTSKASVMSHINCQHDIDNTSANGFDVTCLPPTESTIPNKIFQPPQD
ncbi:hypothetical protein e1004f01.tmp0111 [Eimeria tenella]|uniref:Uncharacterized protein n=1 Tax=Eimeria tenella TaxID=5802 RepID=C8TE25_EIMTE|nr:hypothetical protein e1004f01.tmp0111 [Eimeria tenella]